MYLSPTMHFVGEKNRDLLYKSRINIRRKETNINQKIQRFSTVSGFNNTKLLALLGLSESFWDSNEKF